MPLAVWRKAPSRVVVSMMVATLFSKIAPTSAIEPTDPTTTPDAFTPNARPSASPRGKGNAVAAPPDHITGIGVAPDASVDATPTTTPASFTA